MKNNHVIKLSNELTFKPSRGRHGHGGGKWNWLRESVSSSLKVGGPIQWECQFQDKRQVKLAAQAVAGKSKGIRMLKPPIGYDYATHFEPVDMHDEKGAYILYVYLVKNEE